MGFIPYAIQGGGGSSPVLTDIYNQVFSKMGRIKGADNYSATLTYSVSAPTDRVVSIVHTGTTQLGVETLTETIAYSGSTYNVTSVTYS